MTEAFTDGFFFHPDGTKPASIVARIASGEINPHLDDVFTVALEETKAKQDKIFDRRQRLISRMEQIENELAALENEERDLVERYADQYEAISRYQETGEIDEILIPSCEAIERAEVEADRNAEIEAVSSELSIPDDWQVERKRVDDEYVYVTLKRKRENVLDGRPEDRARKKIQKVIDLFRSPDFDREQRIQFWNSRFRANIQPIIPAAP